MRARLAPIKSAISVDATDDYAPPRQLSTHITAIGTSTISATSSLIVPQIETLVSATGTSQTCILSVSTILMQTKSFLPNESAMLPAPFD